MAERGEELLKRCQEAGMTLASNKVQVGTKVHFAGYFMEGNTKYPNPKKLEAVTKFPLPTTQKELSGCMCLCKQSNHYVPELAGKQAEFRKLLKKNIQFVVTQKMEDVFKSAKRVMGESIPLNYFDVNRKSLVITNASVMDLVTFCC